jgi:hypothetical protein
MNHFDRIISLYLCIDSAYSSVLGSTSLRKGGFPPQLSDVEVLTIEIFDEWQGHCETKSIWRYTRQHWLEWFPQLCAYKTFAKQCANLRWLKEKILSFLWPPGDCHIIDGAPLPLCQFARAKRCRRLREWAAYGHCAAKKMTYWGLKAYPLMRLDGAITACWLHQANEDERTILDNLIGFIKGLVIADKGFQSESRAKELKVNGIDIIVPSRKNMKQKRDEKEENQLKNIRRRIETAIGQLVERYSFNSIKARSILAYCNEIFRKILAYNFNLMIKS